MIKIQNDTYLVHHGILGMKWGVRRYQNPDGTLTAAGKKRYLNDDGSYNKKGKKELTSFGTAKTFQVKTKTGEVLSVEPKKTDFLLKVSGNENSVMGYRGDANYDIKNKNGKTIGELSLISSKKGYGKDTAYADWITIDEEERGKGYATAVINEVLKKAKDEGYSKVVLNALKQPRALYERIGFEYIDKHKMTPISRLQTFEFGAKRMEYDLTKIMRSLEEK